MKTILYHAKIKPSDRYELTFGVDKE